MAQPAGYPKVSQALGASPGTTRKALERLVRKGLVERLANSRYRPVAEEAPMT